MGTIVSYMFMLIVKFKEGINFHGESEEWREKERKRERELVLKLYTVKRFEVKQEYSARLPLICVCIYIVSDVYNNIIMHSIVLLIFVPRCPL